MAYRYEANSDALLSSSGVRIAPSVLASSDAFGSAHAHTLFDYFRSFARFALDRVQFTLLAAVKFFAHDRPLLIERHKVQQIQSKYVELFEWSLKASACNVQPSHVLYSFADLRSIDMQSKAHISRFQGLLRTSN